MVQVPKQFQTPMPFPYPENNHLIFEEWYFKNWTKEDKRERKYLPIFVNGYQVGNQYGKNRPQMDKLQEYIDSLDRSQKYYMIVQYDDGLLCDLKDLDVRMYAMSGPKVDYALPLLCQPMPFKHEKTEKRYLANFVGRITHPVRSKVVEALRTHEDCFVHIPKNAWDQMNSFHYSKIIAESFFTICPRGYGWNSFRIAEALQYGSIPIVISDEYVQPHNPLFDTIITIQESEVPLLIPIMQSWMPETITEIAKQTHEIYNAYFTYEANKRLILEDLKYH